MLDLPATDQDETDFENFADAIFIINERQVAVSGEMDHRYGEPTAQIVSTMDLDHNIVPVRVQKKTRSAA